MSNLIVEKEMVMRYLVAVAGQDILDYEGLTFPLWNGREIFAHLKDVPCDDLPLAITDKSCFTELEPVNTLVHKLLVENQSFTTSTIQSDGRRVVLEWTISSQEPKET